MLFRSVIQPFSSITSIKVNFQIHLQIQKLKMNIHSFQRNMMWIRRMMMEITASFPLMHPKNSYTRTRYASHSMFISLQGQLQYIMNHWDEYSWNKSLQVWGRIPYSIDFWIHFLDNLCFKKRDYVMPSGQPSLRVIPRYSISCVLLIWDQISIQIPFENSGNRIQESCWRFQRWEVAFFETQEWPVLRR